MQVNIKGDWIHYDYSIDLNHTKKDMVIKSLKESTGKDYEYLGSSKAIKREDGKILSPTKKCIFFKITL